MRRTFTSACRRRCAEPGARARTGRCARRRRRLVRQPRQHDLVGAAIHPHRALIRRQPMQRSMTPNSPSPGFASPALGFGSGFAPAFRLHVRADGRADRRRHRRPAVRPWLLRRRTGIWRVPGLPAADLPDRDDRCASCSGCSADHRPPSPAVRACSPAAALPARPRCGWRRAVRAGPPPIPIGPQRLQEFEHCCRASRRPGAAHDLKRCVDGDAGNAQLLRRTTDRPGQPGRAQHGHRRSSAPATWRRPGARAGREYATVAMRFSMIDVTRDGIRPHRGRQPDRTRHGHRGVDLRAFAGRPVDPVGDPAGAVDFCVAVVAVTVPASDGSRRTCDDRHRPDSVF